MKLGYVAPGIWDSVFIDTATTLADQGHDVAVYTDSPRAPSSRRFLRVKENGVDFYIIHRTRRNPFLWPLDKLAKPLFGRRFFTTLVALHRFFRATRDRDVYMVESDWMGLYVALLRRMRSFRWVVGVHDTENLDIAVDYPGRPRARWLRRAKLWVFRSCDAIRANSPVTRDALVEGGVEAGKIAVIPLHIDATRLPREHLPDYRLRARAGILRRYGLPSDARVLMVMCRLAPVKGLELAVAALARVRERCPEALLMICGPDRAVPGMGSYQATLERVAADCGVAGGVIFTGNLEADEVRLHLAAADVHLAPSLIDTFSYSVVDAAMAGTRSLISDRVGIAPWMLRARAGRVVAQRDAKLWAEAILEELAAPPGPEQMAGFVRELAALLERSAVMAELATFLGCVARGEAVT